MIQYVKKIITVTLILISCLMCSEISVALTDRILEIDIYGEYREKEVDETFMCASSILQANLRDNKLHKVIVTYDGESNTLASEYYYENNNLTHSKRIMSIYNPPKWNKKSKVVRENIEEFFFDKGKLLKVLINGVGVDVNKFVIQGKEILGYSKQYFVLVESELKKKNDKSKKQK